MQDSWRQLKADKTSTSYLQGKFRVEIRIESANKDNSHSWVNFLLAWISWSRTWATRSTTTTSRKPLIRSWKNSRWKRKYLLLRADQRPKQNHEDLPLLAHLQGPYPSGKESGLMLSQKIIRQSITSVKTTDYSCSSWSITSRRRWSDWILEIKKWSSERFRVRSALVWWCIEEQDGRRRSQQEKIPVLYWSVRTRNSLSPSSSRSFRTQSHWSFTSGQCLDSAQFLRVHVSYWMCSHFNLHHKFRIDSGRTKIWAKDRRYSSRLWILWTRNTEIRRSLTWPHHVLHGARRKSGRNINTRCIGSTSNLLERKVCNHPSRHTSSLL